ncbi:MAG: hypothetical protein AB1Z98_17350 [Nannocystaceae bacterium]
MVGLVPCSVLLVAALAGPPALPPDRSAVPDPAAEPTDPTNVEGDTTSQPEPVAEPEPTPEPTVVAEPAPSPQPMPAPDFSSPGPHSDPYDRAPIRRRADDDDRDDDEISRYEPGLWGMQFTFGGLAPMSIGGLREFSVNRLAFTELGFRRVLDNDWALLFSVGAGLFRHNPDAGDTQNDVGLAASYGFLRWFRVWKRIAPYAGGRLRLGYAEPEGRANWNVSVGLGPVLGIEYFVGHRVSLSLQGDAQLRFGFFRGLVQTELATGIDAGGQMGLTFYF